MRLTPAGSPAAPARPLARVFRRVGLLTALQFTAMALSAAPLSIDLVLSGRDPVYDQVADGFAAALEASVAGRKARVTRSLAAGFEATDAPVTVAIGMRACQVALESPAAGQLLCTFVPEAGFLPLSSRTGRRDVAAIYLDQPSLRQFALARALLPDALAAGLLAGPEVGRQSGRYRQAAEGFGFEARFEPVASSDDAAVAIRTLTAQSDVIVAAYEPDVLTPSTARWLLRAAHRRRIPIIGYSQAFVDSGALAAVLTIPEQVGRQAADAVLRWSSTGRDRLRRRVYPRDFRVAVNRSVATTFGVEPPPDAALVRRVEMLSKPR